MKIDLNNMSKSSEMEREELKEQLRLIPTLSKKQENKVKEWIRVRNEQAPSITDTSLSSVPPYVFFHLIWN